MCELLWFRGSGSWQTKKLKSVTECKYHLICGNESPLCGNKSTPLSHLCHQVKQLLITMPKILKTDDSHVIKIKHLTFLKYSVFLT